MKIIIVGNKRHGKDHAAEYLRNNFGLSYRGSSELCSELFIFDVLKDKYNYKTPEECFEDRVNHREEWFDLISEYNSEDPTRLATGIFNKHECYCGMRRYEELEACKEKWENLLVIFIDRSKILPAEAKSSCTIQKDQADVVIENNYTLVEFEDKLRRFGSTLFKNGEV